MDQNHLLPQYNLILIRYAEIWLKSQKIKIRMLKYLMSNITKILKRKGIKFNKLSEWQYICTEDLRWQ